MTKLWVALAIVVVSSKSVWASVKDDSPLQVNSTGSFGEKNQTKDGKVFSLFSIVTFKNAGCRSQSALSSGQSPYRNGTCYTSSECAAKGGTASGNCAAGFGVCCLFLFSTSGSIITQNCSYIRNPSFPSSYTGTSSITYTINKCTSDVCYLRLDFESFTLLGPASTDETATTGTSGGSCARDAFKVTTTTGQSTTSIPIICGLNTGQHMYVDMGNLATDTTTLSFTFTTTTTTRNWEIKVSQIECCNPGRPPNGCLQYWTTLTGRITTFNFLSSTTSHLANQDVTACIKRQDGYCCIQYQACPDVKFPFSLDIGSKTIADVGQVDSQCSLDYVNIPGSSTSCSQISNTVNSKYCGPFLNPSVNAALLNVPICDCTSPFLVHFHTDAAVDSTGTRLLSAIVTNSRGDCLDFTQIPCQSS